MDNNSCQSGAKVTNAECVTLVISVLNNNEILNKDVLLLLTAVKICTSICSCVASIVLTVLSRNTVLRIKQLSN